MMNSKKASRVEMIPIARINVLNPRSRNKRQHREIVDNIESVGLKRPITVSRIENTDPPAYDLVCGEGRIEAFRLLGATEIPAIVIEAPEADCLVMSLVENIARRKVRPIDLMQEVGNMRKRGYSDEEIASKIGVSPSYVNMIASLLERGEERLVSAVETGLIPISFAIDIARSSTNEIQNLLMDAYASGKIKGKKLTAIRRLIDKRSKTSKIADSGFGRKNPPRRVTSADLMRVYHKEAEKQRLLVKKSEYAQTKLLFIVEALKDLLADEGFTTLLRAEGMVTMPRALAARISGKALP